MDAAHLRESDRCMTPPALLSIVATQWTGGIDLDPCHDPASYVVAANTYDIRKAQNGAALPWKGRVWCNPPYSDVTPFLHRAQQHGSQGGRHEVLVLLNAGTDTAYFQGLIFPYADVCFLAKRQRFHKVGPDGTVAATGNNPVPSVVCYFGDKRGDFYRVWAPHGAMRARNDSGSPAVTSKPATTTRKRKAPAPAVADMDTGADLELKVAA